MFIERSAGRIRLARLTFVIVALLPCALLAAWAVARGSAGHREAVRVRWQQSIGLPLTIGAVEHPRPGVVRAHSCVIRTPTGRTLVEIPTIEVESAATEDRLRVDTARLDPQAALVLGGLVREWLRSDARHPRNCVIEAGDFAWTGCGRESGPTALPAAGLRIECVAQGETRAVRIVCRPDGQEGSGAGDEVRLVRTLDAGDREGRERFEVDGRLSHPQPLPAMAAVAGWSDGTADAAGSSATVAGEFPATHDAAGWSGTATGRIDEIDLGSVTKMLDARGAGIACVDASRVAWTDGRLARAAIECSCGRGWIDALLFDRLVIALGCRPAPAARSTGETVRSFDAAGCVLKLEGDRMTLQPALGDAVAVAGGAALLHAPSAPVPFDRLAWMLSPPAATFVPADGPGAWLMSVLPVKPAEGAEGSESGTRTENPSDGDGRRGF